MFCPIRKNHKCDEDCDFNVVRFPPNSHSIGYECQLHTAFKSIATLALSMVQQLHEGE